MKSNFSELKKLYPQPLTDAELERIAEAVIYVRDNVIDNCSPHRTCFYVSYMACRLINRKDYNISLTNLRIRTVPSDVKPAPHISIHTETDPANWHCIIVKAEKDNTPPKEIIDFNIGAICRAYIDQGNSWDREPLPEWIRLKKSEEEKYGLTYTAFPKALVDSRQREVKLVD